MKFAEFDIDPDAGVLHRNGARIKLQDLPFRLLVALVRRPGAIVTRNELRAELWGAETFVDAESGLNTAIAKLREALGDNADTPRFIETLPKRGYRFIGEPAETSPPPVVVSSAPAAPVERSPRPLVLFAIAAIILGALVFTAYRLLDSSNRITIAVVRFHNETGNAEHDRLAGTLTDAVVVALTQDARYAVIGNSPLLRTDRIFQDVKRIGEALDADFVVLGQLQIGDTGLLARAHLIRPTDDRHFWASKVDIAGVADLEQRVTTMVAGGVETGLKRAGVFPAGK